jgi:phenylacetate-CoA ligase
MPYKFLKSVDSIYSWSNILSNLQILRRNTWLPYSELRKIQMKKLRCIIKFAYENVAFYHQRFNMVKVKPSDIKSLEDLRKIPVLTKSEVQRNSQFLVSRRTRIENCRKEETSGTTGIPLTIISEKRASYVMAANKLRHNVENGGRLFRDRYVLLLPIRRRNEMTVLGFFLKQLGIFKRRLMCTEDKIEDIIKRLAKFQPDAIDALPSFLLLLARELEHQGKVIRPRLVFSSGELLDARSRRLINSAFEVEMFDVYGCTEAGNIAWECSEHTGYHTNMDLVVTEFVRNGEHGAVGERGEIILTPLWNYAMPLIRYKIGDIGIRSDETCPCGRGLPLMKVLEGRSDDFIILPSGRIIPPYVTSMYFSNIEGIAEYKIIQETKQHFIIQIVLREGYNDDLFLQLKDRFRKRFREPVTIDIEAVDAISRGGKLRRVVSKCLPREKFLFS